MPRRGSTLHCGSPLLAQSRHFETEFQCPLLGGGFNRSGLGGYLAARTDQEHYLSEEQREYKEVQQLREVEIEEVASIFRDYGVKDPVLDQVTNAIAADPKRWVDFMIISNWV